MVSANESVRFVRLPAQKATYEDLLMIGEGPGSSSGETECQGTLSGILPKFEEGTGKRNSTICTRLGNSSSATLLSRRRFEGVRGLLTNADIIRTIRLLEPRYPH